MAPASPGEFEQQVTIDDLYHERIEVPTIGDTRRATVLHDFNRVPPLEFKALKNYTLK